MINDIMLLKMAIDDRKNPDSTDDLMTTYRRKLLIDLILFFLIRCRVKMIRCKYNKFEMGWFDASRV